MKAYFDTDIPKTVEPGTLVVNISQLNDFLLCQYRWDCAHNKGRVPAKIATDFLALGNVGHGAVEDLHGIAGEWNIDAAVGIAHKYASQITQEVQKHGHMMEERERKNREWFAAWLPRAFPQYALRHKKVNWDAVVCVEKPVALHIPLEELQTYDPATAAILAATSFTSILIIGTPDAYVVIDEKIWHCQRKFFSKTTDLVDFAASGPYQKHEIFYLVAAQVLHEQGHPLFAHRAGHTLFDLIRKLDPPDPVEEMTEPKTCHCFAKDEVQHFTNYLASHPVNAKKPNARELFEKHRREDMTKLSNFTERVNVRKHELAHYQERAFVRESVPIRRSKRESEFKDILYTAALTAEIRDGLRRPMKSQGWPCSAYHRPCPYKGVCAGSQSLNGAQFKNRDARYTDIPEEE